MTAVILNITSGCCEAILRRSVIYTLA